MSSSVSAQQGGMIMITQMYPTPPQGGSVGNPNHPHMIGLGAVQIMIALTVFSFCVVVLVSSLSFAALTSIFAWGTLFYIIAGSLTVAAGKSSNRCLMNTTLAFNIFASLVAFFGSMLYSIDAAVMYDSRCHKYECDMYKIVMQGTGGVLAVLHFLEFIITIVSASLACKSTCNCCNQQLQQPPVYFVLEDASMAPQAPPSYSSAPAPMVQLPQQMTIISNGNGQSLPGFTNPPAYSSERAEENKTS